MIELIVGALLLVFSLPATVILRHVLTRLVWLAVPPFQVGRTVTIGDFSGVVEAMGWLEVRLRSGSGEQITIPNATVLNQAVVQHVSESDSQGVEMVLPVPRGVDPGRARRAAEVALQLSPYLALDRPIAVALKQQAGGGIAVWVHAAVFNAEMRVLFESSVIEVFQAHLRDLE